MTSVFLQALLATGADAIDDRSGLSPMTADVTFLNGLDLARQEAVRRLLSDRVLLKRVSECLTQLMAGLFPPRAQFITPVLRLVRTA